MKRLFVLVGGVCILGLVIFWIRERSTSPRWLRVEGRDRWALQLGKPEGPNPGLCLVDLTGIQFLGLVGFTFMDAPSKSVTYTYDLTGTLRLIAQQNHRIVEEDFFWRPCGKYLRDLPEEAKEQLPPILLQNPLSRKGTKKPGSKSA